MKTIRTFLHILQFIIMLTLLLACCLLTMAKFSRGVATGEISFSYSMNGGTPVQVKSGKPVV